MKSKLEENAHLKHHSEFVPKVPKTQSFGRWNYLYISSFCLLIRTSFENQVFVVLNHSSHQLVLMVFERLPISFYLFRYYLIHWPQILPYSTYYCCNILIIFCHNFSRITSFLLIYCSFFHEFFIWKIFREQPQFPP